MIEERQRRAGREGVQPERDFSQFHCHLVLVDAVDAALENEALHQILVSQLVVSHCPFVHIGFGADSRPHVGKPADQGRYIIGPRYYLTRFAHGGCDLVGEIIDQRYKEVTRAHSWIDDLEIEDALRWIDLPQFVEACFLAAPVARELASKLLEVCQPLLNKRSN